MIRLQNEGVVQPPPVLPTYAQQVSLEIQSWPEVIAATHWKLWDPKTVDGAEFHVPEGVLGHIHVQGGGLHLPLNRLLSKALIESGLAFTFRLDPAWVEHPISKSSDVVKAIWLFRLAYDQRRSAPEKALLERIVTQASTV